MSSIVLQYLEVDFDDLDGPSGRHNTCTVSRSSRGPLFWTVVVGMLGMTEVLTHQIVTSSMDIDRPMIRLRQLDASRWASEGLVDLGFGTPMSVVVEGVPEPAPWVV